MKKLPKITLTIFIIHSLITLVWHAQSQTTQTFTPDPDRETSRIKEESFQEGLKVGSGRFAWIHASENYVYLQLMERERTDELKSFFVDNMWLSIVELDEFVGNPNIDESEREAASNTLKKIVLYFWENPKEIQLPVRTNLSEGIEKGVAEKLENGEIEEDHEEIVEAVFEATEGAFSDLETMFDDLLDEANDQEIKTQEVLHRLFEQGFFPGHEMKGAGVIFLVPNGRSSGSSSDNSITFEGETLQAAYDGKTLKINGINHGSLKRGDVVDLRRTGLVLINGLERVLKTDN